MKSFTPLCSFSGADYVTIALLLIPFGDIAWFLHDFHVTEGISQCWRVSFNRLNLICKALLAAYTVFDYTMITCFRNLPDAEFFLPQAINVFLSIGYLCSYVLILQRRTNGLISSSSVEYINHYTRSVIALTVAGNLLTIPSVPWLQLIGGVVAGLAIISCDTIYLVEMRRFINNSKADSVLKIVALHGYYCCVIGIGTLVLYASTSLVGSRTAAFSILRALFKAGFSAQLMTFTRLRIVLRRARIAQKEAMNAAESVTIPSDTTALYIPAFLEFHAIDFKFLKNIATGGAGSILLAEAYEERLQIHGTVFVAKKLADTTLDVNDIQLKMFYQEISVMHLLRHETTIAKLVGYSMDPMCILMKHYPLGSLDSFISGKGGVLTKKQHLKIGTDIGRGLDAMHSVDVAHCDIKPPNVLLDMEKGELRAVLTDFGISRVLSGKVLLVSSFEVVSVNGVSFQYASPEYVQLFRKRISSMSATHFKALDIYSLGMIIFFCLERRLPWIDGKETVKDSNTSLTAYETLKDDAAIGESSINISKSGHYVRRKSKSTKWNFYSFLMASIAPLPKPLAIDPDNGPESGGTVVSITGENLGSSAEDLLGVMAAHNHYRSIPSI